VNEWTNEPQYLLPAPPGRSVFTSFTLDAYRPPFRSWQERLHLSFGRRVAVGCTVLWTVRASVWGWLLCCRGKEQCVALYIISLTSVYIYNCNIRLTTVLLRSQKFVLANSLPCMKHTPEVQKRVRHKWVEFTKRNFKTCFGSAVCGFVMWCWYQR